jgi:hypothetical protein
LAAEAMIATFLAGRDEDLGVIQTFLDEASAGLAIRAADPGSSLRLYPIFPRLGITSCAALRDGLDGPGSAGRPDPDRGDVQ